MKPFVRKVAALAGGLMLVLATIGFSAAQASAEEARPAGDVSVQSNCNHSWGIYDGSYGGTTGNGVNIRTGPHDANPTCTILGQAQMSHTLQYDCWVSGTGGTWSHIYDFNTGVQGWVKDSLLIGNGASVHC